jgi:hypothetical protein
LAYPSVTFTEILSASTRQELEQFTALLQGYLSQQHKEDGSHEDVTADTLETTGAAEIGGALTVADTLTVDGELSVQAAVGNLGTHQGPGIKYYTSAADTNGLREWHEFVDTTGTILGSRFIVYDASGDRTCGGWRWNNARTAYEFVPDSTSKADRTMSLGSPTDGSRGGYWHDLHVEDAYVFFRVRVGAGISAAAVGQFFSKAPSVTGGAGATAIKASLTSEGSLMVVSGHTSTGAKRFTDLVLVLGSDTTGASVVGTSREVNTPATRTYSVSGETLSLSLSGTDVYTVRVTGMGGDDS